MVNERYAWWKEDMKKRSEMARRKIKNIKISLLLVNNNTNSHANKQKQTNESKHAHLKKTPSLLLSLDIARGAFKTHDVLFPSTSSSIRVFLPVFPAVRTTTSIHVQSVRVLQKWNSNRRVRVAHRDRENAVDIMLGVDVDGRSE